MKTGIVVCSRVESRRVPKKCFLKIAGKPLLEHLLDRLVATGYPVFLAVPGQDYEAYKYLKGIYAPESFTITVGHSSDPLARMASAANAHELDRVVRVCHDKIFIEKDAIREMEHQLEKAGADYAYSSELPAGSSLEIITRKALNEAARTFKNVEHISYAVRAVTSKIIDVKFNGRWKSSHRLLLDFPEDIAVLDAVLKSCGHRATLDEAIAYLDKHQWLSKKNAPPTVTVYTCAYNAARWIDKAMGSVAEQKGFGDMEYILIDDASTDAGATITRMRHFAERYPNVIVISNAENKGLASSSNIALENARAPYIVRLDADDYFTSPTVIEKLVRHIEHTKADAVYPDNFFGSRRVVQEGSHSHHIGGTLFRTRAANHVKFTDGLRGYEGLDFWQRARAQLNITYFNHPCFFYRQHADSMTKNNLEERRRLKHELEQRAAKG